MQGRAKKVYGCRERTGEPSTQVYASIAKAAWAHGTTVPAIWTAMRNPQRRSKGLFWREVDPEE